MNTRNTLIAAVFATVFASSAALAQEAVPATWNNIAATQTAPAAPSQGAKTRAEVQAELAAARARGELTQPGDFFAPVAHAMKDARQAQATQLATQSTTQRSLQSGG